MRIQSRQYFVSKNFATLAIVATLWLGLIESSFAIPISIDIPAEESNTERTKIIGTLSADVDTAGRESAIFTLNNSFRYLMNDAEERQFRFYQVITYDDEPVKWNNQIITPAGTPNRTGDVVDVPSGGWDYQRDPTNLDCTNKGGGDDDSPFYESDIANGYCFPNLSYPLLHSDDGVDPGIMKTSDKPGLNGANHKTLFFTFIAYEDSIMLSHGIIDILGGFSWGIMTDAISVLSGIGPTAIPYANIDDPLLHELGDANSRSGFQDWLVFRNNAIIVSEPPTMTLFMSVLLLLGMFRLLRRSPAFSIVAFSHWRESCRLVE